ncbi:MAG: helix-turn-helix domain-containing protein [Synergistales bacterium]|nr:helix-turn-helix domain-containing protein [Synergistales bacterium]
MNNEMSAIFSRIRIAQQKFNEARRELDEAVDMFLNYREEQPVQTMPILQSETDKFLTVQQVCDLLQISDSTFYEHLRSGLLPPGISVGPRSKRWRMSDIRAWQEKKQNGTTVNVIIPESVKRRGRPSKIRRKEEFYSV